MFRLDRLFPSLLALALASCASMAPTTALQLAQLDPLRADPSGISVAILLPDSLLLRDGDIVMTIEQQDKALASHITQSFKLKVSDMGTGEIEGLRAKNGQRLELARVFAADAERLRTLQAMAREQKAAGAAGKGSFTVGIQGGCRTRPLDERALLASIYIKTDRASKYLPLLEGSDLRKQFGAEVIGQVPACST
jgi:hypothetical protein